MPCPARPGRTGAVTRRPAEEAETAAQISLRVYLGYLAVAFVLAVLLSWSYSTTARLGYSIDALRDRIGVLESQREKLSFQLSSFESVARVEREAAALGLVRPEYVRAPSGATASGSATGEVSDAAEQDQATAVRVIRLSSDGVDAASMSSVAKAEGSTGRGGIGALWERFYRWLTGISQAEARDWR